MDDLHQWQHQGIGVGVVNNSNTNNKSNTNNNKAMEKKLLAKPANKDEALNCPRCASTNTKFCYYNNYSLTQPRYFCKTCRRYWTQGGSLRNVPVGGGSRKNRRPSLSSSSSSPSVIKKHNITNNNSLPDQHDHHHLVSPLPIANLSFLASSNSAHHDLNLAYPSSSSPPTNDHHHHQNIISKGLSLMSGGSPSNFTYPSSTGGFTNLLEFKPPSNSLNFSLHNGFEGGGGYGSFQLGLQEGGGGARVLFPVEDLKPMPNTGGQNGDSNGYWNAGMLGGGSW